MRMNLIKTVILVLGLATLSGCATMKDLFASLNGEDKAPRLENIKTAPKYSDNQNMAVPTDRQYKRMNRQRMEEESDLGQSAGSSWVMEGQGAYLFAQNKMRTEGDLLNVKLDAPAMKQVQTKVSVIKGLLKQLEDQQKAELNNSLASAGGDSRAPASADAKKEEPKKEEPKAAEKEEDLADIANVPTRIVEKLADGNYRVKGQQPFMIGKREYKVIVTGMIRPEDFNDEGITSQKLLDPQYDVVSIRKNKSNE